MTNTNLKFFYAATVALTGYAALMLVQIASSLPA